jgi:hypothetical protein
MKKPVPTLSPGDIVAVYAAVSRAINSRPLVTVVPRSPLQRGVARGLPMGSLRSMFSIKDDNEILDPSLSLFMRRDPR